MSLYSVNSFQYVNIENGLHFKLVALLYISSLFFIGLLCLLSSFLFNDFLPQFANKRMQNKLYLLTI